MAESALPTETKVAKLVEEGLSNPEITSHDAVSANHHHVSHVLRKLEIRSRMDIACEAALRAAASR